MITTRPHLIPTHIHCPECDCIVPIAPVSWKPVQDGGHIGGVVCAKCESFIATVYAGVT